MNIATCETCNNDGWIISNDESWNTEIQRCDECQQFKSDEEAVEYLIENDCECGISVVTGKWSDEVFDCSGCNCREEAL